MSIKKNAIFYAVLAAALYTLNAPISKLLLIQIPSTMMAGLLYFILLPQVTVNSR